MGKIKTRQVVLSVQSVVDRMNISDYRTLPKIDRIKLMAAAFKAKDNIEKAQEFAYKVFSKHIERKNYLDAARTAKEYDLIKEMKEAAKLAVQKDMTNGYYSDAARTAKEYGLTLELELLEVLNPDK